MRKSAKRFLSSILAFVMVISVLTVMNVSSVFAATYASGDLDGFTVSSTTDEEAETKTTTWTFEPTNTDSNTKINAGDVVGGIVITGSNAKSYNASNYFALSNSAGMNIPITDGCTGGTITITGTGSSSTRYLTFTSDDTKTIAYSKNENSATFTKSDVSDDGYLELTNTSSDGDYKLSKIVLVESFAAVDATGISVSPESAKVAVGGTTELTATLTPSTATNEVTWASSDESVATVDEDGVVTGVAAGSATITATANGYSASAVITVVTGTTNTITWDFSEYGESTDDGATDDGEYNGLTYVLNSNNSNDYIYSGGIHTNGSSNTKRRYIAYTPEYDGTLTVYFKSNNYKEARTGYIGTSVDTSNYLAATTTPAYAEGDTIESSVVSAALEAGTTYYVYFDNGCTASLLTYSYVTIDDDDEDEDEYVYFGISQDDVDNEAVSEYYITDADGNAVVDTDGNEVTGDTVYYGVIYEDDTTADAATLVGTDYVVAFKVTGETGDKSDLKIAFR